MITDAQVLLNKAIEARTMAYAPYSNFKVGCAILCDDGSVYLGCNVENASFGATNCAERTALFKAISDGYAIKSFRSLAVVGDTKEPITPCGVCRQVMAELCSSDMSVILGNLSGNYIKTTVGELLPGAFTLSVEQE